MAYAGAMTQEQLEWIEEATHRAVRKALKRQAIGAAIGFLVLFGGAFGATRATLNTVHEGLVGSCNRVNVLRAQSNLSDTVSFNILSLSGRREHALVKLDSTAAKEHRQSAEGLFDQARSLTVTGITNCEEAVDHPAAYRPPIATPLGVPETGKLSPGVAKILADSKKLLVREDGNG